MWKVWVKMMEGGKRTREGGSEVSDVVLGDENRPERKKKRTFEQQQ